LTSPKTIKSEGTQHICRAASKEISDKEKLEKKYEMHGAVKKKRKAKDMSFGKMEASREALRAESENLTTPGEKSGAERCENCREFSTADVSENCGNDDHENLSNLFTAAIIGNSTGNVVIIPIDGISDIHMNNRTATHSHGT
jgi:hypothetical protein